MKTFLVVILVSNALSWGLYLFEKECETLEKPKNALYVPAIGGPGFWIKDSKTVAISDSEDGTVFSPVCLDDK